MVILYSTHCPSCEVLAKKLRDKNIQHFIIDDATEIANKANELGMHQVPFMTIDGTVYGFMAAVNWVNSQVVSPGEVEIIPNHISYIVPTENGCRVVMIGGNSYDLDESYDDFRKKLDDIYKRKKFSDYFKETLTETLASVKTELMELDNEIKDAVKFAINYNKED